MSKSPRSQKGKEKIGFWLLNPASKTESFLLTLFFILLPTQLGKHFWPDLTLVSGIRVDYLSPILYVTDVILIFLFCSFLLSRRRLFSLSNLKTLFLKWQFKLRDFFFLFIILFLVCNTTFATSPLLSLYGLIKLGEFTALIFYLTKTIHSRFQLQQISLLFAVGTIFESILAIMQYIHQGSLNGIFYFLGERAFSGTTPGIANESINGVLILRPYGTFSHPNVLAGYLLGAVILVWGFLLTQKKLWIKIFATITLLIGSVALLLTFSRVAIFFWGVCALFVLGRMLFGSKRTLQIKLIGVLLFGMAAYLFSTLPFFQEIIGRFAQTSFTEESVVERTELLHSSWIMIQQHPFMGVGLNNFIPALAPLQKPLPLNLYLQPVHNIFVLVAAQTGLIGLVLFLLLLILTFINIKKRDLEIKGTFYVLLLFIMATGFFDHYWLTLQQGQLLFATVIGLCWANISNDKSSK